MAETFDCSIIQKLSSCTATKFSPGPGDIDQRAAVVLGHREIEESGQAEGGAIH
jgi:hypothetical protein